MPVVLLGVLETALTALALKLIDELIDELFNN